MIAIELVDVEPIGTHAGFAFYNNGPDYRTHTSGPVTLPTYPEPCGEAVRLRETRVALRLGLGAAARRLGLTTAQFSGLERGRLRPADESNWPGIITRLSNLAED